MKFSIIKNILLFFIGFFSCAFIFYSFMFVEAERPFGFGFTGAVSAPSNWVSKDEIVVLKDRIILMVDNAGLSSYASTGSMKPTFDSDANGIRIKPESAEKIQVGDIVSFRKDYGLIVHRVIQKGIDEKGIYFVTKGDNSEINDGKIRFEDIEYVTIGVIW